MVQLTKLDNSNLARVMYSFLVKGSGQQVWVRVPINAEECVLADKDKITPNGESGEGDVGDEEDKDTWAWWDSFRSAANYEKKMGLALEIAKGEFLLPFGCRAVVMTRSL